MHAALEFSRPALWGIAFGLAVVAVVYIYEAANIGGLGYTRDAAAAVVATSTQVQTPPPPKYPPLDKAAYDKKMWQLANATTADPVILVVATSSASSTSATSTPKKKPLWPVTAAPYPKDGALLPFNRIVAYYGNFYSKGMGVLGQYPTDVMLQKLASTTEAWRKADPATPVIPAIHYIVETAQGSAQADGTYRLQMPDSQIDHALDLATQIHGIVFLDFQVGKSTLQKDLPVYEKYLKMPNVHLGIDPEFSMKDGVPPGREIGTFDASDVNFAAQYLAKLVDEYDLPPKILIVHRFTEDMVTHAKQIKPLPEVQIVMDMDGWGSKAKKTGTYNQVIYPEPVQFTGFKLFYKNDILPPSTGMFTPKELLLFKPQPIYIQYQ